MSLSTRIRSYKSWPGHVKFLVPCVLFALPGFLNLFPLTPLRALGPTGLTERVSLSSLGVQANGDSGKSATVRRIRAESAEEANDQVGDDGAKQQKMFFFPDFGLNGAML